MSNRRPFAKAIANSGTAADVAPHSDPQTLVKLLHSGQFAQAEQMARDLTVRDPRNPLGWKIFGTLLVWRECYRDALPALEQAHRLTPDDAETLNNLGHACHKLQRFDEALECYRLALTQRPDFAEGWNNQGITLHALRRLAQALDSYDRALALRPTYAKAHNNRGTVLCELGRHLEALSSHDQALALDPQNAEIHSNRGTVLQEMGRLDEALKAFDQALTLNPHLAEAHGNRGNTLRELGRRLEALACHDRALMLAPRSAEAHSNRGMVLQELGRLDEALACHTQALAMRQDIPSVWVNLGATLHAMGRLDEALKAFDQALSLPSHSAEAHTNRGLILQTLDRLDEAQACFERALAIKPRCTEALNHLGVLKHRLGQMDAALSCFGKVLAIKPDHVAALINRGNVLKDLGWLDSALADNGRAMSLDPASRLAHSNLLFILNYHPDKSAEDIFSAYQDYDRRFGQPDRANWQPHANHRSLERRLCLGYVSPDFRGHSSRNFLEPLLAQHDRRQFRMTAYAELRQTDALTARYRGYFDQWVPTGGLSDEALAERIRADGIDILIDVAGHTANNRLDVFARRPAPVSVSWMGYGYTTGLSAIDYFLADEIMVPPGSEHLFAEEPWRIAAPSLCYRPDENMGAVGPLPAFKRRAVTFGTLTRSIRINHRTIRLWSAILQRLPGARLIVDSRDFAALEMQQRLAARFATHGIARERLEIGYHSPPWDVLRGMDIGLDCFPHNSGSTLIESLYMGVPFITLAARPSVGRIGSTILAGAGHPEWIAASEDDYIDKAVALAGDLERLAAIRASLRDELETGTWRDEAGFAHRIEQAYRGMWRRWCTEQA